MSNLYSNFTEKEWLSDMKREAVTYAVVQRSRQDDDIWTMSIEFKVAESSENDLAKKLRYEKMILDDIEDGDGWLEYEIFLDRDEANEAYDKLLDRLKVKENRNEREESNKIVADNIKTLLCMHRMERALRMKPGTDIWESLVHYDDHTAYDVVEQAIAIAKMDGCGYDDRIDEFLEKNKGRKIVLRPTYGYRFSDDERLPDVIFPNPNTIQVMDKLSEIAQHVAEEWALSLASLFEDYGARFEFYAYEDDTCVDEMMFHRFRSGNEE